MRSRYIADIANRTQYAKSKGIEVAGYDLIGWSRNPPNPGWIATDPINPTGVSACMASGWHGLLCISQLILPLIVHSFDKETPALDLDRHLIQRLIRRAGTTGSTRGYTR